MQRNLFYVGDNDMKNYSTILWDLDGTLLDFKQSERYALDVCLAQYGVTMTEEMLATYSAINESYWKKLERSEVTKAELLVGRFRDFFEVMGINNIDPVEIQQRYQVELGTKTFYVNCSDVLLQKLKNLGYKQYIVTNGVVLTQNIKMKNSGFDKILDGLFISDQIGYEKPHVEFFEAVFEQIPEKNKEKIILVGDSLSSDMKGANLAQIRACWYNPSGSVPGNEQKIDWEIQDLNQILEILEEV